MSISPWITFLGGLIVGGLIGLFMGRQNYESCQEQLDKMTAELQARKAELSAVEAEIEGLQQTMEAPKKVSIAPDTTAAAQVKADVTAKAEDIIESAEDVAAKAEASVESLKGAAADLTPDIDVEAPTAQLKDVAAKAEASVESLKEAASDLTPDIDVEAPTAQLKDVAAKAEASVESLKGAASDLTPDIDVEAPTAQLKDVAAKAEASVESLKEAAPDLTPDIDVEAPTAQLKDVAADRIESIVIEEVETSISQCPQKLARIHGIGRVYEDKLYHAGIGTFWQVATTPAEKLAEIFGIKDFQAVDLDAIRADARRLAEETGTVGHVWSGRKPDDFESLPGIGKTYETRLYEAGICTFEKLAAMTEEELAAIVKAPNWNQPDYAAWIAYARERIQAG